jgi:hypothetical protein
MAKRRGPPAILVKQCPSSSSDKIHEVRISRNDGKMYCTCRGWTNHKHCRHTDGVTKEEILTALEYTCDHGVLGL